MLYVQVILGEFLNFKGCKEQTSIFLILNLDAFVLSHGRKQANMLGTYTS